MGDYNIIQWIEKIYTDDEVRELIEIYNRWVTPNINIALIPFVNHEVMLKVLRDEISARSIGSSMSDPHIQNLYDKLDEGQYWMDITHLGDLYRREYNTVTEQVRTFGSYEETGDDFEILGNVRKAL